MGKSLLLVQQPIGFGYPPTMPVSADGITVAFSTTTTRDSITVSQPPVYEMYPCPHAPCVAMDISGTGKAILVSNSSAESPGTLVWTLKHGFRNLTQLVQQYGGDTQGRILGAEAMSDDGQAFIGLAIDPTSDDPLDYIAFYASLPVAAYD